MKNESEFCTIIKNSMVDGFKIPDPSGDFAMTIKRAFDGIGMIEKDNKFTFVCWEAKFLKELKAFSFKNVRDHQDYYLNSYTRADNILCYLIVGIDVSRTDKRAYIFDYKDIGHELYQKEISLHKSILDKLPYNPIKNGLFSFNNIITKSNIIYLVKM